MQVSLNRVRTKFVPKMLVLAMLAGAASWLFDTVLDAYFGPWDFTAALWPNDPMEIVMRVAIFLLVVSFGAYASFSVRRVETLLARQGETQRALDTALRQVISGYVPICAWCNKIEANDTWQPLEKYIAERSGAQVSHGICPECETQESAKIATAATAVSH